MVRLFRKLHSYLYLASVLFFFTLFYPALWLLARSPERNFGRIAWCRKAIAWLGSTVAGIFYRFHYEADINWSRPCIICANHTSNLDITAMVLLCPAEFSFMGKIELLNNPVTGLFFKTIDIPLDRESKVSAFRAFKKAQQVISSGKSMVIFPEGRIGEVFPPTLYPFKNGPFRLAIETQVPIIPVVIRNAWKIHWDEAKQFGSRPGIVHIDVLPPIETKGLTPEAADRLRDEIHAMIAKRWNGLRGL